MKTRFAPVNQKKALAKALKPYTLWDQWIITPHCFLSPQQIKLVQIYQQTGSYAACREHLYIGMIEAANELIRTTLLLKVNLHVYQTWEQGQVSLYDSLSSMNIKTFEDLKRLSVSHYVSQQLDSFHKTNSKAACKDPP